MRILLFATIAGAVLWPGIGIAQVSGAIDTSAGGSVRDAIDTRVRGAVDDRAVRGGANNSPPRDVQNYVGIGGSRGGAGRGASVGDSVPRAEIRSIPGQENWGYADVNGQRVIINRQTGTVSEVVR